MKALAATLTSLTVASMALPLASMVHPVQSNMDEALRAKLISAAPTLDALARKAGLLGWPELAKDGSLIPGASWDDRFFSNDRALLFSDGATGAISALVLMPVREENSAESYRLMWVSDMLGTPRFKSIRLGGEKPGPQSMGDVLLWEESRTSVRLHRADWFEFGIGPSDSDNITKFLGGTGTTCPLMIDELTDSQGKLEGVHHPMDEDFAQTMTRSDFQSAVKKGESRAFVWFEVKGKPYAAKKKDWLTWLKGPRPSVTKEIN